MIRAPIDPLVEGPQRLTNDVAHYLVHVRRMRVGERCLLFCSRTGEQAICTLTHIASDHVDATIDAPARVASPEHDVTLLYALAKGDKIEKVIQDATELGAQTILVVETARSIVRLDAMRSETRRARWERVALDAARQSGRVLPLTIVGPIRLDACEASLPPRDGSLRIAMTPGAKHGVATVLLGALTNKERSTSFAFAIGPEGGFSPAEYTWLDAHGFHGAHLGPYVLRTETVAAAVLGTFQALADLARTEEET